ncbi:MAG: choice-of-anchor J domain-containing protein [Paludibacteraceae bacterium]|nr:choice-of-anchor J domain-containing protein [Paludibacteraceae bacterium]
MRKLYAILAVIVIATSLSAQITTLPWQESFTGYNNLPDGWDNDDYVNPGYTSETPSLRWTVQDEALHFTGHNVAETRAAVKSPVITLPNNYDATLMFRLKNTASCGKVGVYVSTDGGTTYLQNPLDSNLVNTTDWADFSVSLAAYRGQSITIVFYATACLQPKVYYTEFSIDDIEIDASPICKMPINLHTSDLSDTSATLWWDLGSEGVLPDQYQFQMSDAFGHRWNETLTSHYSTQLQGLTPNTEYTISLRSDCSSSSKGFSKYSTMSFTTLCTPQNLPFIADFDNTQDLPSCCITEQCEISTLNGSMKMSAGKTESATFISPRFAISADSIEISMKVKRANPNYVCKYFVGLISDPMDGSTFMPLLYDSLSTGADWIEVRANSSQIGFSDTNMSACIFLASGENCVIYIDDLIVRKIPTCVRPEGVTASNVGSDNATISWTSTGAAQYRVTLIGESDTTYYLQSGNSINLIELTPNRDYRAKVRALCESNDSSDLSNEVTFHTLCAIAATPYFSESFEAAGTPECWSSGWLMKISGSSLFSSSTRYRHTGTQSISLPKQQIGNRAYLSTNLLPLTGNCDVALWIWRDLTSDSHVRVWVTPDATDTIGGVCLGTLSALRTEHPAEASDGWYMYQFPIPTSGNKYIMLEGIAGSNAIYIDDLSVIPSPTCRKVSGINATAQSSTSALLSWTQNGSASQWLVNCQVYSGASSQQNIQQTVSTPQIVINGLSAGQYYNISGTIASLCGNQDTSESVSFNLFVQTPCTQAATLPLTEGFESDVFPPLCWQQNSVIGTDTWYINSEYHHLGRYSAYASSHYQDGRTILTTPKFTLNGTASEVKFNMFRGTANGFMSDEALYVYLSTVANDTTNAILLGAIPQNYSLAPIENVPGWHSYTFAFPAGSSGDKYVQFVYHSQAGSGTYIDDITIRNTPTCSDVQCSIDSITDTTVVVTMVTQGCSTWQYMVDANPAVTVNDMSATITNLIPYTTYQVKVRQLCGQGYGEWSDPIEFKTACKAAILPYIEDFETTATGTIPGCISIENYYSNTLTVAVTSSAEAFNHTEGGSKGLTSAISADNALTPAMSNGPLGGYSYVHLEAGTDYEYILNVRKTSSIGQEYNIAIYYGLSPDHNKMTLLLAPQLITSPEWEEKKIYFSAPTTGDYYIGFYVNSPVSGVPFSAFIDDISIRQVACVPPTATFVSSIRSTSADIAINTFTGSRWEIAVSDRPIVTSSTLHGNIYHNDNVTSTIVNIPGLDPSTTYYYSIRTVCQSGVSAWMQPESFTTRCVSVSIPYSDSFEDITTASCWTSSGRSSSYSHSGIASMTVSNGSISSPEFTSPLIGNTMTAWVYATSDSATLGIGAMSDPDDPSTFEQITNITVPFANQWYKVQCQFATLDDPSARHIAITYIGKDRLYIDDIDIVPTPSCTGPEDFQLVSATANSITVSWTSQIPVIVKLKPSEGGASISTLCQSSPAVIQNLQPSTLYILYTACKCGQDTSEYMMMGYYSTACGTVIAPYTESFEHSKTGAIPNCWDISASVNAGSNPDLIWNTYGYNSNRMIRLINYGSRGSAITRSPQISLPAGRMWQLDLDYSHRANCGNFYIRIFKNGTISNLKSIPQGSIESLSDNNPGNFTHVTLDLTAYAGETIQLQFNATTNNGSGAIFVDNIRISEKFSCTDLSGLTLSAVAENEATIQINDTATSHTQWQYIIGEKGLEPTDYTPVTCNSRTISLSNLQKLTEYDIVVRAACSATEHSNWSRLSFKTTATPATIPYHTDFTSGADNVCWVFTSMPGSASQLLIGSNSEALLASPQALYVSADDGDNFSYEYSKPSSTNAYRTIALEDTVYKFDISYRCSGGLSNTDYARIYLIPASMEVPQPSPDYHRNNAFPSSCIALDNNGPINGLVGWQHISKEVDLRGRAGAYNLVFLWANDSSSMLQTPLSVGYVSVEKAGCANNLSVSAEATSSTVKINVNGSSNYEYRVARKGSPEAYEISGTSTASTLTLTGFTHSTRYYLFVRNLCADGSTSTWQKTIFQTDCGVVTQYPFVETFSEALFPPTCWESHSTVKGMNWDGTPIDGSWGHFSTTMPTDNYSHTSGAAELRGYNGSAAALATPLLHIDSAREYHLSFYLFRRTSSNALGHVTVSLSKTVYPSSDAIVLGDFTTYDPTASVDGPRLIDIDIPKDVYGDYHVVFEGFYVSTTWIFVDDVTFDVYPPCRTPVSSPFVLETTSSSATAYIDLRGKSGARMVIAPFIPGQTSVADSIAGVNTTDGNVTFAGLNAGSMYAIYARIECSEDNYSDWSAMARAETKADECFAPDGLRLVGQAGPTSVTVTYGHAADATTYEYVLTSDNDTLRSNTNNDTLTFTTLTPSTDYTLRIRTLCTGNDSTIWSNITFRTLGDATTAPYSTGFEDAVDNAGWEFALSASHNNFVISGATEGHKTGNYGLYISNDHASYAQSVPSSTEGKVVHNITYAMRTIWLEPGIYEAAFDWRCDAYVPGEYSNSYFANGRAFLAPASTQMTGDAITYLYCNPVGSMELFAGSMKNSQTWQHSTMTADVKTAGYYKIVFAWLAYNMGYANASDATAFPLAIDNFSIEEITCRPPSSLDIVSLRSSTIDIVANNLNDETTYEYGVSLCENADSIATIFSSQSDTLHLTGLTPKTHYYIYVRHTCSDSDKSPWRMVEATTNATEATVPYVCQFADMNENSNWVIACRGAANYFVIGNAVMNNSGSSLYISDDGTDNHYDTYTTSTAYAYRTIHLDAGYYDVTADWRAYGVFSTDMHAYDFGRLFLIPTSVEITDNLPLSGLTWNALPGNAISLDNNQALINQGAWETTTSIINITKTGDYNLVAYWYNQDDAYAGAGVGNPPVAFDNISVTECLCSPIKLRTASIGETTADVVVTSSNYGAPIRYTLSNIDSPYNPLTTDTVSGDTLHLTGLSPSCTYYIYAQALCSEASSKQARLVLHTSCGTVTALPYCEGFESFALNSHINNLSNICWNVFNYDAIDDRSSATPYYGYIDNTNYLHSGVRSLRLHASDIEPLVFVLPDVGDISDVAFSLWYMTESTSNICPMKMGYVTNPYDPSSFVELQQFNGTGTMQRYSQAFVGTPDGARIALSYGPGQNTFCSATLDDIRVSRLIHAPEVYDTICYGIPYIGNGFYVQANKLYAGDNELSRVKLSPTDNGNDTLFTTHLYVEPQIHTDFFDTCCVTQSYVKGEWNIPNPVTGSYIHNYTTAAGCDSAVILYLHVLPATNVIVDTICTGGTYTFHGRHLTDPGMYIDSALNALGCMTIDTLYLMVLPDTIKRSVSICYTELPYQFYGKELTASGTYAEPIIGSRGCQQTDLLTLYVVPTDTFYTEYICQGGTYLFFDTVITTAGTYTRKHVNPFGCDMTHHVTVSVNSILVGDAYSYACQGIPYSGNGINGLIVTQDTTVDVRTKNQSFCDSLTHVHLDFVATKHSDEYHTINKGETYTWNDNTYSKPGDYNETLTSYEGCDSIVTLHLTVIDGIEENYSMNMAIIPNPVSIGQTTYLTGEYDSVEKVEVINSLGQVVEVIKCNDERIELKDFTVSGIYHVRITMKDGKVYGEKLIVR